MQGAPLIFIELCTVISLYVQSNRCWHFHYLNSVTQWIEYTVSHSFSLVCFWTPIYFTCICSRKPTFFLWLLLQFSGQWPVAWLHTDRVLHTVRKRKERREEIASTQFCSNIKRQTSDDKLCSQHTVKNGRLKIFGLCLPEDKP